MSEFFIIPTISIHPDEIYMYGTKHYISNTNKSHKNSLSNLKNNIAKKDLSSKAKRKAKRAIKYLLYFAHEKIAYNAKFDGNFKFKVNFITLTLSSRQQHSDKELKQILLNQFFIEAKKKWGLKNYVWKAERQKNGNLHFHILTDVWIPWLEMRNTWNRLQEKLGYITEYRKSSNKPNPNSTDIHSLRKVKNVPAYVLKYMIKKTNSNNQKVHRNKYPQQYPTLYKKKSLSVGAKNFLYKTSQNGRIWACSHTLSNIRGACSEIDNNIINEIDKMSKLKGVRRINKEFFSGIFFDNDLLTFRNFPILYTLLHDYRRTFFEREKEQIILNT